MSLLLRSTRRTRLKDWWLEQWRQLTAVFHSPLNRDLLVVRKEWPPPSDLRSELLGQSHLEWIGSVPGAPLSSSTAVKLLVLKKSVRVSVQAVKLSPVTGSCCCGLQSRLAAPLSVSIKSVEDGVKINQPLTWLSLSWTNLTVSGMSKFMDSYSQISALSDCDSKWTLHNKMCFIFPLFLLHVCIDNLMNYLNNWLIHGRPVEPYMHYWNEKSAPLIRLEGLPSWHTHGGPPNENACAPNLTLARWVKCTPWLNIFWESIIYQLSVKNP